MEPDGAIQNAHDLLLVRLDQQMLLCVMVSNDVKQRLLGSDLSPPPPLVILIRPSPPCIKGKVHYSFIRVRAEVNDIHCFVLTVAQGDTGGMSIRVAVGGGGFNSDSLNNCSKNALLLLSRFLPADTTKSARYYSTIKSVF